MLNQLLGRSSQIIISKKMGNLIILSTRNGTSTMKPPMCYSEKRNDLYKLIADKKQGDC